MPKHISAAIFQRCQEETQGWLTVQEAVLSVTHLSSMDERHLEWGVRGLHQQSQIQDGGWTFSCHPCLCETQAPILHDPISQRASGQVMPSVPEL